MPWNTGNQPTNIFNLSYMFLESVLSVQTTTDITVTSHFIDNQYHSFIYSLKTYSTSCNEQFSPCSEWKQVS